jgi:hypothetical protein
MRRRDFVKLLGAGPSLLQAASPDLMLGSADDLVVGALC